MVWGAPSLPTGGVNLAVCGKFHVLNYAETLIQSGVLSHLYFAHRDPAYGRSDPRYVNLWPKEYAVQGLLRLSGGRVAEPIFETAAALWTFGVLARWSPASILHQLAVGAAGRIIARARNDGATIVSEAINTHPGNRREILARESRTWGLAPVPTALARRETRIVDEVFASDVLLAPTRTVAESYRSRGYAGQIETIPYAANISAFTPPVAGRPSRPGEALRVLCVGQIGLRKGQLYLLEATQRMRPRIALTLVGSIAPDARPVLQRYAGDFRHIERAPHHQIRELLQEHDVFILPSLEEGLAVSLCEAMATGIAVVATAEAGAEELLTDGVDGLLIPPANSNAIQDALQQLGDDPDLRVRLGHAARAAAERHNWARYARRLAELYARLHGGSHYARA